MSALLTYSGICSLHWCCSSSHMAVRRGTSIMMVLGGGTPPVLARPAGRETHQTPLDSPGCFCKMSTLLWLGKNKLTRLCSAVAGATVPLSWGAYILQWTPELSCTASLHCFILSWRRQHNCFCVLLQDHEECELQAGRQSVCLGQAWPGAGAKWVLLQMEEFLSAPTGPHALIRTEFLVGTFSPGLRVVVSRLLHPF